jgi:hypothetical protein
LTFKVCCGIIITEGDERDRNTPTTGKGNFGKALAGIKSSIQVEWEA